MTWWDWAACCGPAMSEEMTTIMSATRRMAELVATTRFEQLPDLTRERVREHLKDTLGVAIAAATEQPARTLTDLLGDAAEQPDGSYVIGSTRRSTPWDAAWANGSLSHLLDYDDYGLGHPSACVVPAALAAGELRDSDGREFMLALALGWEVFDRLAKSCRAYERTMRGRGLHVTAIYGGPAAAAAASRLLGLDADRAAVALGLAGSSSTGLTEQFGTWSKGVQAGTAARAGVLGALLAERDYWATDRVLEGPHGLLNAYAGEGNYDLSVFEPGVENGWGIEKSGISVKLYPACGGNVRGIEAALRLREELLGDPLDIARIEVEPSEAVMHSLHIDRPERGFEGKFCLRYTVATALADGEVTVDSFSDEKLARPVIQTLMDRTTVRVRPGGYQPGPDTHRTPVLVEMSDGRSGSHEIAAPRGHLSNRLSYAEISEKFVTCARRLGSEHDVKRLDALIDDLPNTSVRELVAAIQVVASPSGPTGGDVLPGN
jgi:2-methylcitrate dehydratase PrpD